MMIARLLTIGTEITSGEVLNSNAAWISEQLENLGVRVYSHLTVRDQREEILTALREVTTADLTIVTGGLGPTSDDLTRAAVAEFCGAGLEFDEDVWRGLAVAHHARSLTMRESHRHQCYFPVGSERLPNPVGTALGFKVVRGKGRIFVLPGPPRELAGMWTAEVEPRLRETVGLNKQKWVRWTCLGVPESEVADLVEPLLVGHGVEVGYRAQVPYVKVKIFVDPEKHAGLITAVEAALEPWIVAHGTQDLADELLERWPHAELRVVDHVTRLNLINRLFEAQRVRLDAGTKTPEVLFFATHEPAHVHSGVVLNFSGDELHTELHLFGTVQTDKRRMPFKVKLDSERGRRAAAEWAIWHGVKTLRSGRS